MKNENLEKGKINEILRNIKDLKYNLQQLNAKQKICLEAVKTNYSKISTVKYKLKVWTDKLTDLNLDFNY